MSHHHVVSATTLLSSEATSQPATTGDAGGLPVGEVASFQAAYERRLGELSAIEQAELLPITLDIPTVTTIALGALPAIRQLRGEIVRVFKEFDLAAYDSIGDYTQALFYADSVYAMASKPAENLAPLFAQASELYETILQDARALGQRRFLDKEKLAEFKDTLNGYGYRTGATSLFRLATLLSGVWPSISSKTALQHAELYQAQELAMQILVAVGHRETNAVSVAEASLRRQQAFTRFLQVYELARQAASHLRWAEDDADMFVPSLYAGRGNGNHRKAAPPATPETTTPATPEPATPAPATPASPAPALGTAPGQPGSNPFVK
jgi:hypothetical protein